MDVLSGERNNIKKSLDIILKKLPCVNNCTSHSVLAAQCGEHESDIRLGLPEFLWRGNADRCLVSCFETGTHQLQNGQKGHIYR